MSKLLDGYKKWLTLEEAVVRISNFINEPFTRADIFRFTLEGHLVLSLNFFNSVKAKRVTLIKKEDIKFRKVYPKNISSIPDKAYLNVPINAQYPLSREYWLENIEDEIESLSGVWDLSMIGTEKFSVKQQYLREIASDLEVKVPESMSVYVKGEGVTYQLQILLTMEQYRWAHKNTTENKLKPRISDSLRACPANTLDDVEYIFVLRVIEVERLIRLLGGAHQEVNKSSPKVYERNNDRQLVNKAKTRLKYAAWKKAAIELKKKNPNKPKTWIAAQIAKLPISEGKSADTIRKNIKI